MLRCIIVDDEPNAVSLLELLIKEATSWEIVDRCYNGIEALRSLKAHQVDFVLLDINMPLLNGMELAALVPPEVKIVFTTAYSEYAAESYLVNALDYLLKPITLKRFISAQQKIESFFDTKIAEAGDSEKTVGLIQITENPDPAETGSWYVKVGRGHQKIQLKELLFVEGDKEYVKLVTGKETFMIYRRLKVIEEQLKHPFMRVHNSYIVNLNHVDKFIDNHILIAGRRIPVSDKYRARFQEQLKNNLF